ncbi:MAG: methyltransferase domain-containing protein [Spirochaetota bacterium]
MDNQHERRFDGGPDRLRNPERIALMEVPRVISLSLEGPAARNVLDVGTGTGVFAEAFATAGLEVTGLDVNPELLAVARGLVPSARFQEGLAEHLGFPDRSFDLVFFGLVLHETDDALMALKEAHRVTSGRVAILEWAHRAEPKGPPLEHRMKPEAIEDLAAKAGFSKVETIELGRLVLYRLTA